ncbi:type III secretion protein [Burkholderia ubonensis]|uniref:Type III secretion protein n=1 Tax=Burkholderia ubonensis subsp. mesacidophila TaxID=265293 RepID=A0A2A4FIA7_9BURK|nr:type III secretion protein [Burkholderia ubonensis]PCE32400.1 type III secretion protein [Burkholderia ubonensis subsp. mesacidophila]
MYEALERAADAHGPLEQALGAPDAAMRIGAIRQALGEAAERVSAATAQAASDYDRDAMQKIYRGLLAAQRIVATLHEANAAA